MRNRGQFPIQTPDGVMVPTTADDACEVIRPEGETDRMQPAQNVEHRLNYRLLLILAAIVIVSPLILVAAHEFQMHRMASAFLERADKNEAQGNLAKSAKNLAGYLRFNPDDINARIRMVLQLLETAETTAEKRNAFLQLSAVLVKVPQRDDLRRRRAKLLLDARPYSRENLTQAKFDLDVLIGHLQETSPDDEGFAQVQQDLLELYLSMAECCEILSDNKGAIRAYRYAIRIDPGHVNSRERLATLLSRQGARDEAEDVLKRLVQNRPDSAEAFAARAKFYYDGGNLQAAIRDARTAYEKAPHDSHVLLLVAALISAESRSRGQIRSFDVQNVREKLEDALQHIGDAAPPQDPDSSHKPTAEDQEIEDQRAILIEALANLDLVSGQPEAAIRRLRKAITESPENVQFRWSLANVLIGQRRLRDAQILLDDIDEQDLPGPLKGFLQARILEAQGEWRAAIEACKKISANRDLQRMFPGGVEMLRGRCESKLGHAKQELIAYQQAVEADSGSAAARFGLAGALVHFGRIDEAEATLREVKTTTGVPLVMVKIELEKNFQRPPKERDWTAAQQLLDVAANQGEDIVEVLMLRARVEQYLGNYEAARKVLAQAQRKSPDRIEPWLELAELDRQTGTPDKALQTLQEAEQKLGWDFRIAQSQLAILVETDTEKARQLLSQLAERANGAAPRAAALQLLAVMYERLGDNEQALAAWDQFSQMEPTNFQAYLAQFDLALRAPALDRIKGADGILAKMTAIEGKNGPHVRLARAQLLIAEARRGDRQRLDEARDILNDLNNGFVMTDKVLVSLADWEALEGNQAAATNYYRDAIARGSNNPRVIRELVRRFNAESRFSESSAAIDQFRKNSRRPLTNELRYMTAQTLVYAGEYDEAIHAAMQSISPDSTNFREHLWFAQLLIAANKMKAAETSLRSALIHGAEHVETWVAWLWFLKKAGRDSEIAQAIKRAEQQFPRDSQALALAKIHEAVDDIDIAEKYYLAAVAFAPDDAELRISVAEFFNRINKPRKAEPHLQHVLAAESTASTAQKATARRVLALSLERKGTYPNFQAALKLLEENLAEDKWATSDQRLKAFLLARQNNRKSRRQALQIYRQLQESGSLWRQDRMVMVKLLIALGEWPQAKPLLTELMNDPECPPADLAFGIRAMMDQSETQGIDDWLKRLANLQPNDLQILNLQARHLIAQRKDDEAIALLEAAMLPSDDQPAKATKADVAVIYLTFAEFLDRTGRTVDFEQFSEKSEQYLRETMDEHPQQVLLLVRLMKLRGQYDEALKLLDESWSIANPEQIAAASLDLLKHVSGSDEWIAKLRKRLETEIEKSPPSGELLFQAANLAHLQQDYDAAIRWYRQALEKSPTSVVILNELAVLLALNERDLDEALELINRAIYLTGPNSMLLDTRAMIHLAKGNANLAIEDLQNALDDDASPAKYYHMAQARDLARDEFAARTAFRQALAAGFTAAQLHPLERKRFQELSQKLR